MNMFDQRRYVFTLGDVGHHSEVLNKIIYSWFNNSPDDVVEGPDASLTYMKVSMSQYGKPFLTGLLFHSGCLNQMMASSVKLKKEALSHLPLPVPGDNPRILNQTWPICAAMHLKSNPDIRMIEQINASDPSLMAVFTPYGKMNSKVLEYCYNRHLHYQTDLEISSIDDMHKSIQQHNEIDRKYDLSFLYDVVYNTYYTIEELKKITGTEPITDESRLRSWFDVAHQVYKTHYER